MKLPWITDHLKINKTKRLHKKSKNNPLLQTRCKHIKRTLQTDMLLVHQQYVEIWY